LRNSFLHINVLIRLAVAGLVWMTGASCAPRMIEVEGHRVFNPEYLWYLESENRCQWQKPDQVIQALQLSEGAVIADIGAGGGYFTERFSKRVGRLGHVYAVDVQDIMIGLLKERVKSNKLENVTVIKGKFETPMLPLHAIDIAFFSSVYKEIEERTRYMKEVRRSLKPGGRVAIIEFYKDRGLIGPELADRLYETQVIDEMKKAGFVLIQRFDFLPKEYFLLFGIANKSQYLRYSPGGTQTWYQQE
jgi:arsenite methyltransferase